MVLISISRWRRSDRASTLAYRLDALPRHRAFRRRAQPQSDTCDTSAVLPVTRARVRTGICRRPVTCVTSRLPAKSLPELGKDAEPVEALTPVHFVPDEASTFECLRQALRRARQLARRRRPPRPRREQFARRGPRVLITLALLVEPSRDCVFRGKISIGRLRDRLRRPQACSLPFEAPSMSHCNMPGHSAFSFSVRSGSRSSVGIVIEKGIR